MSDENYFDSDEYQAEIASEYDKRIASFPVSDVVDVLGALGFSSVDPESIKLATGGNIHATYTTPDLVIKLNQDRREVSYRANKIISDRLNGKAPVVHVLAYDNFEKTNFEALVMERARGSVLQHDIFELSESELQELFGQVLQVVRQLSQISFTDFGPVNDPGQSFATYTDCLAKWFREYLEIVRRDQLADEATLGNIERYYFERLGVFDGEKSVFVHTDLHMGNLMHVGKTLTAVIDFDHADRSPAMVELATILGFIGLPQQFVEGRPEFPSYKGKNFYHLLPTLKESLPELFDDPHLLSKLNLLYIGASIGMLSENWSARANHALINDLLDHELAASDADLARSAYARRLRGE